MKLKMKMMLMIGRRGNSGLGDVDYEKKETEMITGRPEFNSGREGG